MRRPCLRSSWVSTSASKIPKCAMAERRAALGEDANTGDSLAENPSRSWAKRAECQLNRHVCVRQWTVNFASEQSAGVWNYSRTDYVDNFQCCSSIRDLVERLH